ncbi:MAG: AAA family ATPase [Magnetococcales bacterium]|nr:AAA family ATPase [Magnetococcales bacterium]
MPIKEDLFKSMSSETPNVRAIVQYFHDIQEKPIRWLWKNRIAKGKLTLVVGHPGVGKSQVGAFLAAMTSAGNGLDVGFWGSPEKVIILSAEDDPSDTTKPRLEAAGADMTNVISIKMVEDMSQPERPIVRRFSLQKDMHVLEAAIVEHAGVSLLLIDPISEYMQGVDSHSNAQVRELLASLSDVAERHAVAVVAITHPNKGSGSAIDRVTGSGAFVAAARAVYLVCRDRDDPELRLFLPVKMNMGKDSLGLSFRIEEVELSVDIKAPRLVWQPDVVAISADEALSAHLNPSARQAVDEAKAFLQEALGQGPQLTKDLKADATGMGISWASVRRAQKLLNIKPAKVDFQGGWMWFMPGVEVFDPDEDVQNSPLQN